MEQNQIEYKGYTLITKNQNIFNTQQNNNKHYFVLKHFANFIKQNHNNHQFTENDYRNLYIYLEKLGNFYIYIKDAKCNYNEMLSKNDIDLLQNS